MRQQIITRPIDDMGRVIIPNTIRRLMDLHEGDMVEMLYDDDTDSVTFTKYALSPSSHASAAPQPQTQPKAQVSEAPEPAQIAGIKRELTSIERMWVEQYSARNGEQGADIELDSRKAYYHQKYFFTDAEIESALLAEAIVMRSGGKIL